MLVESTLLGEINKIDVSIERIKYLQNRNKENKNILAFSGGKDSVVIYYLAVLSGIPFTPIYSRTSVDPPELIHFIEDEFNPWVKAHGYPEVVMQPYKKFNSNQLNGEYEGKEITMWSLIETKKVPPTRGSRYCCEGLKERTGEAGDTVFVGVRWEESKKRSKLSMFSFYKGKKICRPIIEWSDNDVWEFIHMYNLPYCKLYDQGFCRIGCIGCPLSKNQEKELEMYPKYKENYIRAFDKMLKYGRTHGKEYKWKTGAEVMTWWLNKGKEDRKVIDGQCSMF